MYSIHSHTAVNKHWLSIVSIYVKSSTVDYSFSVEQTERSDILPIACHGSLPVTRL